MDIVYGHRSYFLELAKKNGNFTIDGRWMLLHQGVQAFEHVFWKLIREGLRENGIESPMRYALTNFEFNEPQESLERRIRELNI